MTIAIGVFLVALDGTITAVANPVLGAQLGASLGGLQWVTNIYLLALASTLVLAGRLGDRWGRRRVFLIGVTGFAIASAVVGLAVSVEMAVVGRGLQGLFGSLIITNAISLLRLSFPPERLPIALSTFAAVIGASSAAGPIIGGVLVEQLSWRWAFLINAPIAVVGVVAGLRLLRRGEAAPGGRFDVPGVALLMATMLALVFGLITAPETSWTAPVVVACLALALVLGVAFVLVERRAKNPLLPLSLFADRSVSAAAGLTVLTFFSLVGSLFFVLLFLQQVNGDSPIEAGLHVLPLSIANVVASSLAGRIVLRFGVRMPLVSGMALAALGFLLFGFVEIQGPFLQLAAPFAVLGLGLGLVMTCGMQAILMNTPEVHTGAASGVHQTANQIGGVLGTSVLGAVMAGAVAGQFPDRLRVSGVPESLISELAGESSRAVAQGVPPTITGVGAEITSAISIATDEAFLSGMHTTMFFGAAFALVGMVIALFVQQGRPLPDTDTVIVH
ncbi:DHA2 family efflux MFS transporter permease subunit [Pseudonocardia lutea]|uniref:DHA2 family efflux MFS transporter permease subunit n=1 Tax=Pseudonocardia lutea TaxID=2172015 RepID=A0ABW1IDQ3_9PSEU